MKKRLIFAMMALLIAVFAAGCNNSAPKENKMSENEEIEIFRYTNEDCYENNGFPTDKIVVFRCISEDYYENAGFLEITTKELDQLIENANNEGDGFFYDSINSDWFKLDSSHFKSNVYPLDPNWPHGQKYALIFNPPKSFSKIIFVFNARENKDAKLLDCTVEYNGYMFQVVSDNLELLEKDLSRSLSISLDGPMMRSDTLMMKEFGLI